MQPQGLHASIGAWLPYHFKNEIHSVVIFDSPSLSLPFCKQGVSCWLNDCVKHSIPWSDCNKFIIIFLLSTWIMLQHFYWAHTCGNMPEVWQILQYWPPLSWQWKVKEKKPCWKLRNNNSVTYEYFICWSISIIEFAVCLYFLNMNMTKFHMTCNVYWHSYNCRNKIGPCMSYIFIHRNQVNIYRIMFIPSFLLSAFYEV